MSNPASGSLLANVTPVAEGGSSSNSGRAAGNCGCLSAVQPATARKTAVRADLLWHVRCRLDLLLGQASGTEGLNTDAPENAGCSGSAPIGVIDLRCGPG